MPRPFIFGLQSLWSKYLPVGDYIDNQAKFPAKFCKSPQTLEVKKNP